MATGYTPTNNSSTVTQYDVTDGAEEQVSSGVVRLRLGKPKSGKKVSWTNDTVDNEHLGKKKSKCCCVYVKPRTFDESSSSESEGDCEHCTGHVEHRKKKNSESKGDPASSQMA